MSASKRVILILLVLKLYDGNGQLHAEVRNVTVTLGEDARIVCMIYDPFIGLSRIDDYNSEWYTCTSTGKRLTLLIGHHSRERSAVNGRYRGYSSRSIVYLAIANTSLSDEGYYKCIIRSISFEYGNFTCFGSLVVQYKPDVTLADYHVVAGDVYVIKPEVSANPDDVTYQWTTDVPGNEDAVLNEETIRLMILESEVQGSIYTVTVNVTNSVGTTSTSAKITISHHCFKEPCENGGTCKVVDDEKYNCSCTKYFTGSTCSSLDPCFNEPCENGGTCRVVDEKYICNCTKNFTGSTCSIIDTESNSNNFTSLTMGMFFVGICVGIVGLFAGFIVYMKIMQKTIVNKKSKAKQGQHDDTHMEYMAQNGNEDKTYMEYKTQTGNEDKTYMEYKTQTVKEDKTYKTQTVKEDNTYQDLQQTQEESAYVNVTPAAGKFNN